MKSPSTETSCRNPLDWIQATCDVIINDLTARLRWDWKKIIAWHIWEAEVYGRIKARVRFIRFDRFSAGEATDDFW